MRNAQRFLRKRVQTTRSFELRARNRTHAGPGAGLALCCERRGADRDMLVGLY